MRRRPPFFAVFDEFQEFLDTGRDMAAFFERSRSYGVGLTVATQNPNHPRLRPILDSVLINTRTHVVFGGLRVPVRHFTDEMALTFSKQQLDGLPAYHMAITTLVDDRPARPFEAAVAPIPTGDRALAAQLRARWPPDGRPAAGADRGAGGEALRRVDRRHHARDPGYDAHAHGTTPAGTTTGVKVGLSEPLDGRDPNPRAGA